MTGPEKKIPPPANCTPRQSGKPRKHHWHEDKRVTRESRNGWTQARCCQCDVRVWAMPKLKKSCAGAEVKGPAFKVEEVEAR